MARIPAVSWDGDHIQVKQYVFQMNNTVAGTCHVVGHTERLQGCKYTIGKQLQHLQLLSQERLCKLAVQLMTTGIGSQTKQGKLYFVCVCKF